MAGGATGSYNHLPCPQNVQSNVGESLLVLMNYLAKHLSLLHYLLEHEILVASFMALSPTMVEFPGLLNQLVSLGIEEFDSFLCQHHHLVILQTHHLIGILRESQGVAANIVIRGVNAHNQGIIPPCAYDLILVIQRYDYKGIGALKPWSYI